MYYIGAYIAIAKPKVETPLATVPLSHGGISASMTSIALQLVAT